MKIKQTKIWGFFSSIKLAIWLFSVIALLSMIGTFIPQNEEPGFYLKKYGESGYNFLLKTGLTDVYASWWFLLSLILFSINLTTCLLNRLSLKGRSIGVLISHASVLFILVGGFIGMRYGEKGYIMISEGEEINSFMMANKQVNLGFSIKLDDFIYNENIDQKEKLLVYCMPKESSTESLCRIQGTSIINKDEIPIAEMSTEIGLELKIADTGYKVKILRYVPDFVMNTTTKEVYTRSAKPNNPAIEVELSSKEGETKTFWMFARHPDMQPQGANFKFVYNWVMRRPKDFISKVTVLKDNKDIMKKDIQVNDPLRFAGYTFFQSSYDNENLSWSGLQVVKDPGVPVIYLGFVLLIAGLVMIFYITPLLRKV